MYQIDQLGRLFISTVKCQRLIILEQAGDHAVAATAVGAHCINACTHAARNVALLDLPSSPPDSNLSHIEMLTVHPD